jgi:outer membrane protein assembly factor BamD (BamD/ComL family)
MPRYLAIVIALLLIVPPVAIGQPCGPASRTKAKNKKAGAKTDEEKAKAMLEKAQALLNDGKRKQARKQLRKLIRKYPKTKAGIHGTILLSFTPP